MAVAMTTLRRRIVRGLAAVALMLLLWGVFVLACLLRGEHFYLGRPTSYWRTTVRWWDWYYNPGSGGSNLRLHDVDELLFRDGPGAGLSPAIYRGSPDAVPVLLDLLRDNDPKVREEAVWILAKVGTASPAVVPALAGALSDEHHWVGEAAADSLHHLAQRSEEARSVLSRASQSDDYDVRSRVESTRSIRGR
jgi:HEAT repeats